MNFSALYHVFPATFHVISRKVDYLWASAEAKLRSKKFVSKKLCSGILALIFLIFILKQKLM